MREKAWGNCISIQQKRESLSESGAQDVLDELGDPAKPIRTLSHLMLSRGMLSASQVRIASLLSAQLASEKRCQTGLERCSLCPTPGNLS